MKMEGIHISVYGGGVFSHFHQFLENILRIQYKKYKKFRLIVITPFVKDKHIFDNIFCYDDSDKFVKCETVFEIKSSFFRVNTFPRFNELKSIMSTFKFQQK
jgi:hypothetical protein